MKRKDYLKQRKKEWVANEKKLLQAAMQDKFGEVGARQRVEAEWSEEKETSGWAKPSHAALREWVQDEHCVITIGTLTAQYLEGTRVEQPAAGAEGELVRAVQAGENLLLVRVTRGRFSDAPQFAHATVDYHPDFNLRAFVQKFFQPDTITISQDYVDLEQKKRFSVDVAAFEEPGKTQSPQTQEIVAWHVHGRWSSDSRAQPTQWTNTNHPNGVTADPAKIKDNTDSISTAPVEVASAPAAKVSPRSGPAPSSKKSLSKRPEEASAQVGVSNKVVRGKRAEKVPPIRVEFGVVGNLVLADEVRHRVFLCSPRSCLSLFLYVTHSLFCLHVG
eukprot:COSAG01_NODE_350_length_18465_cov_146.061418_2_plen_332_part_00